MNNYFESILMDAVMRLEGYYPNDMYNRKGFWGIYPFMTENNSGYINNFNLENKSLLTVGSSGGQVINASLVNCRDITVVDICPFTKFYFYLNMAAIITLDYNSYISFFCYRNFPEVFKYNKNVFNLDSFNKLKPTLRLLDYESYLFWDELFSNYPGEKIRKMMFEYDEDKLSILKETNLFLKNETYFDMAKTALKKVSPKFIIDDIWKVELNRNFDNIWLSNIGTRYQLNDFKVLVDKMYSYLNENGKMLVSYLYNFAKNTKYVDGWLEIYDLDIAFKVFNNYDLELISFKGIKDFIFDSNLFND